MIRTNSFDALDLTRLLEVLPDAVLILDSELNLLWANQRAEEVFQATRAEWVGRSVVERIHPGDFEIALRAVESVAGKGVGDLIEVRALVGAEWRLFELIGREISWLREGALLFTFRDITEQRRGEIRRDDAARFKSLVQYSSTIVFQVSASGIVDSVSGAITRTLGHDTQSVEHRAMRDIVAPDDWEVLQRAFGQALEVGNGARPVVCGVRLLRHGALDYVHYELSLVNLLDDATVNAMLVTAHDVSTRVAAESDLQGTLSYLRDTTSLLNATLEASADGIMVVDSQRRIVSFNSEYLRMWNFDETFVRFCLQRPSHHAVRDQLKDPDGFVALVEAVYETPEVDSDDVVEFLDGRVFRQLSRPQYIDGVVVGRVWTFVDVTTQKKLEAELQRMAFYDDLTGLANRALFYDHVNQAIARLERNARSVAVLYLDLDNFKTINDSLGHSAGDEQLRAVGKVLLGCVRRADTVARLGGDEFGILIEDVDSRDEAVHLAQRILSGLHHPVVIGSHRVSTSASIGITFGGPDATGEQLLRNADLAMYRAKALGKDRYEEFEDHMHQAVLAHLELENDLRRALVDEQFIVHYQPIMDLSTRALVGFEALVRWNHPTRGLLGPGEFITKAEELGIIGGIDLYVLSEACRQISQWTSEGLISPDLVLDVNVSASEVADPLLAERVCGVLQAHGFDAGRLVLEITESALMTNVRGAGVNLRSLKDLGLRLAVDDFGTGYSSLTHLAALPIDVLKIDRSFVAIDDNLDDQPDLARAIIQLAETLNLHAVAEGVETEEQAGYLLSLGCRWAQGFHLGRPLDIAATELLIRQLKDAAL